MHSNRTSSRARWLLYGATGYTGSRIAARAVALGYQPMLASRSADKVRVVAERLGLEWRAVDLSEASKLETLCRDFSVVLNAAGPFAHTYAPIAQACLSARTHYLDLTGELPVFEAVAAMSEDARNADVMLMCGVGFDMVPGDCLGLRLKRLMPDASELDIGLSFEGTLSRGTILSALMMAPTKLVRRANKLVELNMPLTRQFDFGPGRCGGVHEVEALTFGDISVGWRTTGIPNITSYQRYVPEFAVLSSIRTPADVETLPPGPDEQELQGIPTRIVGEVRNASGEARSMRLATPQIYAITFDLAATIAQRVHSGTWRAGFQTPASVFGENFILQFEGCHWETLPASEEKKV